MWLIEIKFGFVFDLGDTENNLFRVESVYVCILSDVVKYYI